MLTQPVTVFWCSQCGRTLDQLRGQYSEATQQFEGTACSSCGKILCDSCNPSPSRGGTLTCSGCAGALDPVFGHDGEAIHQRLLRVLLAWTERFREQPIAVQIGNRTQLSSSSTPEESPGGRMFFDPIADGPLLGVEALPDRPGHRVLRFDSHLRGTDEPDSFLVGYEICAVDDDGERLVIHKGNQVIRLIARASGVVEAPATPPVAPMEDRDAAAGVEQRPATTIQPQTLTGHRQQVNVLSLALDGLGLLSGSHDKTLRLWNLATGHTLRTLDFELPIPAAWMTPDGSRAFSGSSDGNVRVWDLTSGRMLHTLKGHRDAVYSVAGTADGRRLVSASRDYTLRVWDLRWGMWHTSHTLEGHGTWVSSVAVTADGRTAVSGPLAEGTLRVWDLTSGRAVRTLEGHTAGVSSVAVTADGRVAVSGSHDKTVRAWDLESGRLLGILEGHRNSVTAVAITPDGRWAVSGSADETVRVWDLATGQTVVMLEGHRDAVLAVAVTPDGRHVVAGGSWDGTIWVWDLT